uniref:Uncharacterized protein n=1 Tax=Arundo donax TaxID=35708 RepID=A0A0A9EYL7_ARUDO
MTPSHCQNLLGQRREAPPSATSCVLPVQPSRASSSWFPTRILDARGGRRPVCGGARGSIGAAAAA